MNTIIKIAIIGRPNSGKSTFIEKHRTGDFDNTLNKENKENREINDTLLFNYWSCILNKNIKIKFVKNPKNIKEFDGMIYFFTLTRNTNFEKELNNINQLQKEKKNLKIVCCCNKSDLYYKQTNLIHNTYNTEHNTEIIHETLLNLKKKYPTYFISCLNNSNIEKPLQKLQTLLIY